MSFSHVIKLKAVLLPDVFALLTGCTDMCKLPNCNDQSSAEEEECRNESDEGDGDEELDSDDDY